MSNSFSLSKEDAISLLKGLGIAVGGAALTYLTTYVTGANFGPYTPVVVALWSVIVNAARKYFPDSTEVDDSIPPAATG